MAWLLSCDALSLLLLLLQTSLIAAQNTGNIPVGRSLLATTNGSSWHSPSDDFAFGFTKLPNTSNLFLLAIWYAKIQDTIVWYADNRDPVPEGSSVKITATDGLVLNDPNGTNLWSTYITLDHSDGVTSGFMNDSGNFVLKNSNDDLVWQSFDDPKDTLLPGQSLDITGVVNSRRSQTNFTDGRFQLRLIGDGNLVLNTRGLTRGFAYDAYNEAYYEAGTNGDSNPGQKLIYDETGYMYVLRENGSRYDLLPKANIRSAKDYYQRATLNFDGVLTWNFIPKNSVSRWSMSLALPDNICMTQVSPTQEMGSGICGFNSICSLGDDKRPTCGCPEGYSLVDPDDEYGSCKPNFKLDNCEGHGGNFQLVQLPSTDWPLNDYERLEYFTEGDCYNSCLDDCYCDVAIFQFKFDVYGCWKKKAPLFNGRRDSTITGTTWIKVGNVNISNDPLNPSNVKNKMNTVTKVFLGSSLSVNILLLTAIGLGIFFVCHKKQLYRFSKVHGEISREYSNVHCFSHQELKEATNGFKEEVGRGAFGIVYKGTIDAGGAPICVAVKKLDRISGDTDKEFKTEVNAIGQTQHKNLVKLIGFCKEDDQQWLVYEYMSKGSLADYIFRELRPSWIDRVQIAQGIARGLYYLHEECSTQIIHCDIKPQNILLDENQNACISDFGLAKLLVLNKSHTNTAIRGTKGYVAPEWFRNKPVTVKVDVYSFGVLLLEIICCQKNVCTELIEQEKAILTDWAFDCYRSNRLDLLVNDDMEALNDRITLKRFILIALWCIQEDPSLRPTMRRVTLMLEGLTEVPDNPPCPFSFSITTQN